jgi:hypothetical protein
MPAFYYYRRLRATGIWHILHTPDGQPRDPIALCGAACMG